MTGAMTDTPFACLAWLRPLAAFAEPFRARLAAENCPRHMAFAAALPGGGADRAADEALGRTAGLGAHGTTR